MVRAGAHGIWGKSEEAGVIQMERSKGWEEIPANFSYLMGG